jgi:hypothetical protein
MLPDLEQPHGLIQSTGERSWIPHQRWARRILEAGGLRVVEAGAGRRRVVVEGPAASANAAVCNGWSARVAFSSGWFRCWVILSG